MPVVQTPPEFIADFTFRAKRARNRVWMQAMVILWGETMAQLEKTLAPLPQRGVDLRLQFDWITGRHFHEKIVFWPAVELHRHPGFKELRKDTAELFQRLLNAGATITVINPPTLIGQIIPIMGRNHIKIFIVDDTVWLGGVNIYDSAIASLDFMVRFDDPSLANICADQFRRVNDAAREQDAAISFSDVSELIIDAGARGVSAIYDAAVNMVHDDARRVTFVSQMVPEGKLLDRLIAAADRGGAVEVYTSRASDVLFTRFPFNLPYKRFIAKTRGNPRVSLRHLNRRVHAKLLIVDSACALFGSHNLVDTGVWLGTAEIAVRTRERQLVHDLLHWVDVHTRDCFK